MRAMPLIIDGHNLIGKTPGLSLQDPDDEAQLVVRLSRHGRRLRKQMLVVFDGAGSRGEGLTGSSWVKAQFAAGNADDAIVSRLRKLSDRANYTVVTSDRDLAQRVERLGARVQSSEAFSREMQASEAGLEREESDVSPEEIAEWLEMFNNMSS